jgi:copper chaperone
MNTTTIDVPGIHCGHCKSSIEGAVGELDGIVRVEVGIDARQVEVEFDESTIGLEAIVETIEAQGYDVRR